MVMKNVHFIKAVLSKMMYMCSYIAIATYHCEAIFEKLMDLLDH